MALLLHTTPASLARWLPELRRLMPDTEIRMLPDIGDPADIEVAVVWHLPPGILATLPRLRLIAALGAGVDHIFGDPALPRGVPVVRLVDPYMMTAMTEYVVFQVLRLHRQDPAYMAQQRERQWQGHLQPNAGERRVGILGLGELGQDAARQLTALGFDVAGWSRTPKQVAGVTSFDGARGLAPFLARSDILVCLLPLTPATEGILDARLFAQLPTGAAIVNSARGGHLVEADLIPALDQGRLSAAVLDVFRQEPLPPDHPFWHHPRIIVTPHIASTTNPATGAPLILDNIARMRAGAPLRHQVDLERGY